MSTRTTTLPSATQLLIDFQSENSPALLSLNNTHSFLHISTKGTLTIRGSPLIEPAGLRHADF